MIVTKKYINDLREHSFLNISKDMEIFILEKFGKEPKQTKKDMFMNIQNKIFMNR
ncbi:hypothetical protein OSC52_14150 [Clostridium pasteurianum]|uniref:hypothetical protein n=1 Tax=Clostridium pasteurianum TaxID=1501 RepID=UPI002260F23B|nr:hypothetical protein [Clostridium pasteurianum]UZW12989.1 hypothetical protein OSC52_14150 [Clostridium pasteurianum]